MIDVSKTANKVQFLNASDKYVPGGFLTGTIVFCLFFILPALESQSWSMVIPTRKTVLISIFQTSETLSEKMTQELQQIQGKCENCIFPIVFSSNYPRANSELNYFPKAIPVQIPAVVIDGDAIVYSDRKNNWTETICNEFTKAYARFRRRLSLYVSVKRDRDDMLMVLIDICNLEESRTFSGRYVLLLLKNGPLKNSKIKTWIAVRNIAEKTVHLKPQTMQRSCPLPDQIRIDRKGITDEHTFFLLVLDSAGRVQSMGWDAIEGCEETDDN